MRESFWNAWAQDPDEVDGGDPGAVENAERALTTFMERLGELL
jgi:hypothetical protein